MSDYQKTAKWAYDLLQADNAAILDTETTGLGADAQIVQIAAIDLQGHTLFDSYVKPTVPIELGASQVHGIGNDHPMLLAAPTFEEIFIPLLRAIGKRDVAIFNADFDLKLIRQSFRPYGIQLAFPTSDRRGCRIWFNGGSIHCIMLQFSAWVGEWNDYHGNYRWQNLPGGDHSAIGDCRAALAVIQKMAASYLPVDPVLEDSDDAPF